MSRTHTSSTIITTTNKLPEKSSDPLINDSDHLSEYSTREQYLTFNILGKIFLVKSSLFQKNPNLFYGTTFTDRDQLERFYDRNRQQYVIDISPIMFEYIIEYYRSEKLYEPSNIHVDYLKETLTKFHIDASSLDIDERYERYVSRQTAFQLIHVLLEYPDACRLSQILHYLCSMIALMSCFLISFSLTFHDSSLDLYSSNATGKDTSQQIKSSIAHFRRRSSTLFIIDTICLGWAIVETLLRTLATPSLFNYFVSLGFFDITGVIFHSIYIYMIATGTAPKRCQNPSIMNADTIICIGFYRRLIMLNLLRKFRLVRYIRPVKHFVLSLLDAKREVINLVVLLLFLIICLAPMIFILESPYLYECSSHTHWPMTRCIRTITDACYYLILVISTVGYGDVYPTSQLARFIAILASPLSIMMLSVPLSAIYSAYMSIYERLQMQLATPEYIRYLIYDTTGAMGPHSRVQQRAIIDVTGRINRHLKYLGGLRRSGERSEQEKD